jgi:hypothetical protein
MDETGSSRISGRPSGGRRRQWRARIRSSMALLLLGGGCLLSQFQEMERERTSHFSGSREADSPLPLGPRMRLVSVGFQGLLADWYWIRTLHYVGSHWKEEGALGHLPTWPRLEAFLDLVISLNPRRLSAYHYGAFLLGRSNPVAAERIVRQGLRMNPTAWQLSLDLGYLLWETERYQEAALVYQTAADLPGAPAWLSLMAAIMHARGGASDLARVLLVQSCETTQDPFVRDVCHYQLRRLAGLRQGKGETPPAGLERRTEWP